MVSVEHDVSTKQTEFRAGWVVLLAATLGCGLGQSSLPFYSLGAFIGPLNKEFGWGRGDVTSSFLYSTVALALTAPILGLVIDRVGGRIVALIAIPLFAAVLFALSQSNGSLLAFHGLFGLAALVGGGTTPVNYSRSVNRAFDKARGMALGISLAGMGVAAIVLPPLLTIVNENFGWRGGYKVLALLSLVPWVFILFGLGDDKTDGKEIVRTYGLGRSRALRSSVFWIMGVAFGIVAISISALVVHMTPLLRDAGLSPLKAASTTSIIGVGVLLGRVLTGFVIDRYFAPYAAAAIFVLTALGCALLAFFGVGIAPFAAILIGLSLGAEVDLIAYLTARYFGMTSYGFLYAVIYALFAVGASLGPALAGAIFDATGSYKMVLWGIVALFCLAACALLTLPRFDAFLRRHDNAIRVGRPTQTSP